VGLYLQKWVGRCPECGSWNSFTEEDGRKNPPNQPKSARNYEVVKLKEDKRDRGRQICYRYKGI